MAVDGWKGTYRLFVSDPTAGHVAFIGTLREENVKLKEGALMLIALRLKIDNRQISEIETFIVRSEQAAQNVEKLGKPHPVYLEIIPASERMSRESDQDGQHALSGMQLNDGKGVYPFTDDCERFGERNQTTNVPVPERSEQIPNGEHVFFPVGVQRTVRVGIDPLRRAFAIGDSWRSIRSEAWSTALRSSITPPAARTSRLQMAPRYRRSHDMTLELRAVRLRKGGFAGSRQSWSGRRMEWVRAGAREDSMSDRAR